MIDQPEFGLGAIDSPPDDRDWEIDALYAIAGLDEVMAPPPAFTVPAPFPPVLNQHASPMCVAYSSSTLKAYEDLRDTGAVDFDEPQFFSAIGGGPNGAVIRNALARLLATGYPVVGLGQPERHKIAAYYAVPVSAGAIQSAIMTFGPVLLSTRWHRSWFHPAAGILPSPDVVVGGHAIVAIGWDSRGLRLRNSWGPGYGLGGDVWMPWAYLAGSVKEAWKAADQVVAAPPTATYRLSIAAGTRSIPVARTSGGCIKGWTAEPWNGKASGAPCRAPAIVRGCVRGQATLAYVTAGVFAKRWVRIGRGVTVHRVGGPS